MTDPIQPLAILTRPAGRNTVVMNGLLRRGWSVLECPALEIRDVTITATKAPQPREFDLVVFVSRAAVAGYHSQLGVDASFCWPKHTLVACMGPVTASAIRKSFGHIAQVVHPDGADAQDSEGLWPLLQAVAQSLKKVLIVRGQDGRDWLNLRLREQKVDVTLHQSYERELADWPDSLVENFRSLIGMQQRAIWLLTSVHGIEAIGQQLQRFGLSDWFSQGRFVLTHERLRPALKQILTRPMTSYSSVVASPEDAAILTSFERLYRNDPLTIKLGPV